MGLHISRQITTVKYSSRTTSPVKAAVDTSNVMRRNSESKFVPNVHILSAESDNKEFDANIVDTKALETAGELNDDDFEMDLTMDEGSGSKETDLLPTEEGATTFYSVDAHGQSTSIGRSFDFYWSPKRSTASRKSRIQSLRI